MGLFSKRPASASAVAEPTKPDLAGTPYTDAKRPIFRDGFYYLCDTDSEGVEGDPDVSRPLVWRDGGFHWARPDDPNHFHAHGLNAVDLDPGSE